LLKLVRADEEESLMSSAIISGPVLRRRRTSSTTTQTIQSPRSASSSKSRTSLRGDGSSRSAGAEASHGSSESIRSRTTRAAGATSAKRGGRARTAIDSALKELAARLAQTEVAYIPHPKFKGRSGESWVASQAPTSLPAPPKASSAEGVAFVSGLVQAPLLTYAQEQYLFLRMNFLKFRAEQLRRQIDIDAIDVELVRKTEWCLQEADRVRNQIAESNLRLVVSVAKKLSNSLEQLSDLTSEGLLPLLRAVELFDVGLGNRFSTYATWAVRNQMLRALKRTNRPQEVFLDNDSGGWEQVPELRDSVTADEHELTHQSELLSRLLTELTPRERQVIAARFGLDGHPQGQSLSEISAQLDLSKERVRQIALQALEKLRGCIEP
jgi:RNA polymerase primary sigma factor